MKSFLVMLTMAATIALLISLASKPVPLEQKLIRIHAIEQLGDFTNIENEPIELQAALADMAYDPLLVLKAKAAFLRYPEIARELITLYGSEPEFQRILRNYGESILPAIQYFVANPIGSIEWMNKAGKQYEAIKKWFSASAATSTEQGSSALLTPAERGWYAIGYIGSDGYDFIGQFVVNPAGQVEWLASERVMEGVTQFFGSGLRQLETRYKMDEQITASDVGWASLDVLVFASAVKVLRVGRNVALSTQTASRGTRTAALTARVIGGGRLVLSGARYAKWPLMLGAAYLVVSHPSLISDFLAELATVIGLPVWLVQFGGWMLLLLPCLWLMRTLWWFVGPFVKASLWSFSVLLARIGKRRSAQS